eukprot:PhF_6_TR33016/c4_g1_i1/m.48658
MGCGGSTPISPPKPSQHNNPSNMLASPQGIVPQEEGNAPAQPAHSKDTSGGTPTPTSTLSSSQRSSASSSKHGATSGGGGGGVGNDSLGRRNYAASSGGSSSGGGTPGVNPLLPPTTTNTPHHHSGGGGGGNLLSPLPEPTAQFWRAGSTQPGTDTVVFPQHPHTPYKIPPSSPYDAMTKSGPSQIPGDGSIQRTPGGSSLSVHFKRPLPTYPCGAIWLYLSRDACHYNTKKHTGRILKDPSRVQLYFIYPESVLEIGIMLRSPSVFGNNNYVETTVSASPNDWECNPLERCWFTFTPENGSIFGSYTLDIPLFPPSPTTPHADKRWDTLWKHFIATVWSKVEQSSSPSETSFSCEFSLCFGYGNTRFTAWRPTDADGTQQQSSSTSNKKANYRYSNESRPEKAVSAVVATGEVIFQKDDIRRYLDQGK